MKYGFEEKNVNSETKYGFAKKKSWAFIIRREIPMKYGFEKKDGFETKYGFAEKKMMGICNVMKDYHEVWI